MTSDDSYLDKYERYEDLYDPTPGLPAGRNGKRKGNHKPKKAQGQILAELTDDLSDVELGFETTYTPSRYESGWLLSSLHTFYNEGLITDVLSAIKGGRLASAAWPAPVLTLAISDVPGDDPAVIASGPTVADPTTAVDALKVFDFHGIASPGTLRARLASGELETPKPGDPRLANSEFRLVASPRQMLEAAVAEATRLGITPLILGDAIEGEAREVGIGYLTLVGYLHRDDRYQVRLVCKRRENIAGRDFRRPTEPAVRRRQSIGEQVGHRQTYGREYVVSAATPEVMQQDTTVGQFADR
mgnify:CR=1 FL=1